MNKLYFSPKKVSTHYITELFSFWIWRRRCLKFAWFWPLGALPLGPHGGYMYHMNNFESPAPTDDSCQVWLKSIYDDDFLTICWWSLQSLVRTCCWVVWGRGPGQPASAAGTCHPTSHTGTRLSRSQSVKVWGKFKILMFWKTELIFYLHKYYLL